MHGRSAVAMACALLAAHGCARDSGGPPDLLLVTIDTLRADRLACYGGPPDVGTEICGLARGGTRFAWAFSTASHTSPSVASLLTSTYPAYHGVTQSSRSIMRPDALSVAEILQGAGYATAAFVSNPVLDKRRRFASGFEHYDARMPGVERNRPGAYQRDAAATTDAALAWLGRPRPRPWFAWVHYQDPHGPYDAPGAEPVRDEPGQPELPVLARNGERGGIPPYQALPGVHTPGAYHRRYLDEIRYLDHHLGRLLREVDDHGPRPELLLSSDHGEAFGEDGFFFAHGHSVALDQIRVPLIWRPRRAGDTRVVATPVSLVDVAPTLLQLAGVPVPEGFQGRPLPLDGPGEGVRAIFAEHGRRVAVVSGRSYWTREREPEKARPWYPMRSAELSGDTALPPYQPVAQGAAPSPLEPLLQRFLDESAAEPPGAENAEASGELRERLRALGYVE